MLYEFKDKSGRHIIDAREILTLSLEEMQNPDIDQWNVTILFRENTLRLVFRFETSALAAEVYNDVRNALMQAAELTSSTDDELPF
jgi:hypothetical protein